MTVFIAVASSKGGVAKTVTAVALASSYATQLGGGRVLLLDTDPQPSGTSSMWLDAAAAAGPADRLDLPTYAKAVDLAQLQWFRQIDGFDVVVVDTRPSIEAEDLAVVLGGVDYVVVPTTIKPSDVLSVVETIRHGVRPARLDYAVLIAAHDPRDGMTRVVDVRNSLLAQGVPVLGTVFRRYADLADGIVTGELPATIGGVHRRDIQGDTASLAAEVASRAGVPLPGVRLLRPEVSRLESVRSNGGSR